MKRLATLAFVLVAGVAQANNVWERALTTDSSAAALDTYESALREGDEHALLANTRGTSIREVKNQLRQADAAYRKAAAARPDQAEPYFRIARLIYSFYFECADGNLRVNWSPVCDSHGFSRARSEELIAAWDAAEARAPLDPRLSVGPFGESEILFRRAILHTKLATPQHLEAAARDYEKILARQDSGSNGSPENVVGNLAETYMMLGRLEEAIETYKLALRSGADTSTWYGYAIALDRDERSQHALDVLRSLGRGSRDDFHRKVMEGATFFVPEGEKFYYFALADEALGLDDEAIEYWRHFINSGAHPRYQPRAKAHLDALLKKKRRTPVIIEPPWRGILR